MNDERELLLHVIDEPIVGRDEFAIFLLRESDVDAIVDAHPQRGGEGLGPRQQGQVEMEGRNLIHEINEQLVALCGSHPSLPFSTGQRMGGLDGKNIWGQKIVDCLLVVVQKPKGLVGVQLRNEPFECDR